MVAMTSLPPATASSSLSDSSASGSMGSGRTKVASAWFSTNAMRKSEGTDAGSLPEYSAIAVCGSESSRLRNSMSVADRASRSLSLCCMLSNFCASVGAVVVVVDMNHLWFEEMVNGSVGDRADGVGDPEDRHDDAEHARGSTAGDCFELLR